MVLFVARQVGVLSRNVKIQGDETTEITKWGAHVMLFSPETEGNTPGYVSYIECFRCGQAFNLGRYPLHFHMMVRELDASHALSEESDRRTETQCCWCGSVCVG